MGGRKERAPGWWEPRDGAKGWMPGGSGASKGAKCGEKARSEPCWGLLKFNRTETLVCVEGTSYF